MGENSTRLGFSSDNAIHNPAFDSQSAKIGLDTERDENLNFTNSKWEKIRQQGKKRFVYRYGVLGWGLTTGIFFSIVFELINEGKIHKTVSGSLAISLFSIVLFLVGGYFWGVYMWHSMERRFRN